jgi:SAM-dependent methyltransferase
VSPGSCVVCGSNRVRLFLDDVTETFDAVAFGSSRKTVSHGRILRCDQCGFGFRQVRSTEQEIGEAYRRMDPGIYEAEAGGRAITAARHLRLIQRRQSAGRLLDVGCASGLFLSLAAKAGWTVEGIEPSEALHQKAALALAGKGEVHLGTLEQTKLAAGSFDAITMWDVLEHVPEPVEFLARCQSLLKPDGRLYLNIPNLDSKEARLLGKRWPLLLAEHLNYFNRRSLTAAGQKAGLSWLHWGQRPSSFSTGYILYRLAQHRIPGSALLSKVARGPLGRITIPIYLGELCVVGARASERG